jgi:hypothetical protein
VPFGEAIHPTVVVLALDGATSQQFAIASGFIENWKTSKEFTLAVAADMPENPNLGRQNTRPARAQRMEQGGHLKKSAQAPAPSRSRFGNSLSEPRA